MSIFNGLPVKEVDQFRSFMHGYSKGATIIEEGEQDDKGLFLLRKGTVAVYKNTRGGRELLSTIDAVNFFGEMALYTGSPRTATVEAYTDVVVYSFRSPDLHSIMANPKWGNLLVNRLIGDLKQNAEQLVNLRVENKNLRESSERLTGAAVEIFSVLDEAQKAVAQEAVATAREWHFLNAVRVLVQRFLRARLPEISGQLKAVDAATWKKLRDEGIVPELLDNPIKKVRETGQKGTLL